MSRYPLNFADWLLDDIKWWQFWRKGEANFATGIVFADMADYPSFGEDSKASKIAERIADETSASRLTMWLLKHSAKRFRVGYDRP